MRHSPFAACTDGCVQMNVTIQHTKHNILRSMHVFFQHDTRIFYPWSKFQFHFIATAVAAATPFHSTITNYWSFFNIISSTTFIVPFLFFFFFFSAVELFIQVKLLLKWLKMAFLSAYKELLNRTIPWNLSRMGSIWYPATHLHSSENNANIVKQLNWKRASIAHGCSQRTKQTFFGI